MRIATRFVLAATIALGMVAVADAETVMKQCGEQWQAAKANGTTNGQTWPQFLKQCRAQLASPGGASRGAPGRLCSGSSRTGPGQADGLMVPLARLMAHPSASCVSGASSTTRRPTAKSRHQGRAKPRDVSLDGATCLFRLAGMNDVLALRKSPRQSDFRVAAGREAHDSAGPTVTVGRKIRDGGRNGVLVSSRRHVQTSPGPCCDPKRCHRVASAPLRRSRPRDLLDRQPAISQPAKKRQKIQGSLL